MKNISDIKLIVAFENDEFIQKIKMALAHGFQLYGNPFVYDDLLYQMVIITEGDDGQSDS